MHSETGLLSYAVGCAPVGPIAISGLMARGVRYSYPERRSENVLRENLKYFAACRCRVRAPHLAVLMSSLLSGVPQASAAELGLPAACTLGRDCFVQQFPDMDAGPDAVDPFCGIATYDGHDGTDLRILSLADVKRGVAVIAMADGKVLRLRDGEPDRLVLSEDDRKAVASKECGNGVVIDHGDGLEVQYCHLKQASISVQSGALVRRGDRIGDIGASGLAQFPHVHVTVRRNGRAIDPSTGQTVGAGCKPDAPAAPLFSAADLQLLGHGEAQILAMGLTDAAVDHAALTVSGPPPAATATSPALVGWAWLMKLRKGDRILIEVADPSGAIVSTQTTDPMDRPKASFSVYAGKRGAPPPGSYMLRAALIRDQRQVVTRTEQYLIK